MVISDIRQTTHWQDCAHLFWIGDDEPVASHPRNRSPAVRHLIAHRSQLEPQSSMGEETGNRSFKVGRLTTNE